ncbi:MAG: T9SS type A sorting domain-containing protein [Bacteroidales bacterium]
METKLHILLIFLLLPVLLHAQENPNINRTLNWRFGGSIGINFDLQTQEVNFLPLSYWFGTPESASTISDEEGNLLFYTDGELVFNSEDTVMPDINFVDDDTHLDGNYSAYQGVVILPQAGNDSIYYIFTCDAWENLIGGFTYQGLKYSIVNMNHVNALGAGEVVEKNIPLLDSVGESVVATEHATKEDWYWVVASSTRGMFYSWLLNEDGLSAPVDSFQSTNVMCPNQITGTQNLQFLKFSPKGDLIFKGYCCETPQDYAAHSIIGFNNLTGEFEFPETPKNRNGEPEIILASYQDTTVELWSRATFSPGGNYLYTIKQMSLHPQWSPSVIERYKIDYPIDATDIIQSKEAFYMSNVFTIKMFQNTPFGNIMVSSSADTEMATSHGYKIHLIQNPNSSDLAYFDENVYNLMDIYEVDTEENAPRVWMSFNNTVESWLYNDDDITENQQITKRENQNNLFYPNPSDGKMYLTKSFKQDVILKIYDLTGNLIFSKKVTSYDAPMVNLNKLSSGIYLIEITDNENFNEYDKLIIN